MISLTGYVPGLTRQVRSKKRLLLRVAYRIYDRFGRYPRLERRLSNLTHTVWANYRKLKS